MGTSLIYEGLFDDSGDNFADDTGAGGSSGSSNSLTASELLKPLENLKKLAVL